MHVTYTQNVTDINDRDNDILKKAQEQNTSWQNLSKYWTNKFLTDMKALNWIEPDNLLFASENIKPMIEIIERLLKNKLAYEVNKGIYLDISKKKDFGKLSRYSASKMHSLSKEFEEDLDNSDKKNKFDITLWRPSKPDEPEAIPSFDSPFGPGRPGWHLECSAMAISSLGTQIDIHGGGEDLIFPHHESEIAQSEGATGKTPFSRFWIHTGTVSYKGQKMSKSIGNLVLISDLLKKYSPNAIRYLLLSHKYRGAWEFHEEELRSIEKTINMLNIILHKNDVFSTKQVNLKFFENVMSDDLNTPKALEILTELIASGYVGEVKAIASILGFAINNKQ